MGRVSQRTGELIGTGLHVRGSHRCQMAAGAMRRRCARPVDLPLRSVAVPRPQSYCSCMVDAEPVLAGLLGDVLGQFGSSVTVTSEELKDRISLTRIVPAQPDALEVSGALLGDQGIGSILRARVAIERRGRRTCS